MSELLPEEKLELAYKLYQRGEYQKSLEQYEWFFDNAEKYHEAYDGSKYRSLREWRCLANKYPPAYDSLIKRKNNCLELFNQNKSAKTLRDYMKICNVLKFDTEAIDLFKKVCKTDANLAKSVYPSIEHILVENREWGLCNLCIDDSMKKYKELLERFDELIRISNSGFNGEYNSKYEKQFEKDIQTLFWILKIGNRDDEINIILSKLKSDLLDRNIEIQE